MSSTTYSPPHDGHHLHPPALHLLDEYWFFSNTLAKPPLPRSSPAPAPNSTTSISTTANKDRGRAHEGGDPGGRRRSCRLLLRTPSLPSPHIDIGIDANHHQQQADEVQVEDDDLNWSSIYEGVLRASKAQGSSSGSSASASRRSSALRRAPSMPSSDNNKYSSCREEPEQEQRRRRHHHHRLLARSRSSSVFQSSSDLESIEVQGFRDLGFVFDKEELRESLAAVLPGLKLNKTTAGDTTTASSSRRGPYLSEAWQLVRVQQQSSSIKDQLRMWAQAVASNVRQDHC